MSLENDLIYIDEENRTKDVESFIELGSGYSIVYKGSKKKYIYNKSRIKLINQNNDEEKESIKNTFEYLKSIASILKINDKEEDKNLKSKNIEDSTILNYYFKKIKIRDNSIFAHFLSGTALKINNEKVPFIIFPFGFNLSQKEAVDKALINSLSVIEGPPGTGKTQTILNIIANAIIDGNNVAVVSSNNSATRNVYEKLEKVGLEFIAAILGSNENKRKFIENQKPEIPDLKNFEILKKETENKIKINIQNIFTQINEMLSFKNVLAKLQIKLSEIELEHKYFQEAHYNFLELHKLNLNIKGEKIFKIINFIEKLVQNNKKINLLRKIIFIIKFRIIDSNFYNLSFNEMIIFLQNKYYTLKISYLIRKKEKLENTLKDFSFEEKMLEYTNLSMMYFKAKLYQKYKDIKIRKKYELHDLNSNITDFINEYPLILSTTYSISNSFHGMIYDFVIVDEASQVDLITGALALYCANKVVIVGDLKQLPNVVDNLLKQKTNYIFKTFKISEAYRYSNHSLLSSVLEIFPNSPKTLLREHYRCHPKIIEFCNKKFYNGQLIVLTDTKDKRPALVLYKTNPGNHNRNHLNQRQIDVIQHEIIPKENIIDLENVGIVTPYRNQTSNRK